LGSLPPKQRRDSSYKANLPKICQKTGEWFYAPEFLFKAKKIKWAIIGFFSTSPFALSNKGSMKTSFENFYETSKI